MKISYVRTIKSSYMQMAQTEETSSYEMEVLASNQIMGLLPVSYCKKDEQLICSYDITGKQAIDVIFEIKEIDYSMLLQILTSLSSVLEKVERFLLDPAKILFLPETIYEDNGTQKLWFCYYTDQETEPSENFQKLWEYILTRLDHKDEKAVEIAYQIYDEVLKKGYSLDLIRENLCLCEEKTEIKAEQPYEEKLPEKGQESEGLYGKKHEMERPEKKHFAITWKRESISPLKKVFVQHTKHLAEKQLQKIKNYFIPVRKTAIEPFVFEPEEEEEKQNLPTVLLADKKEEIQGILQYEGEHGLTSLQIETLPYLIGSGKECAGIIASNTVSRIHARITKTEDIYFIEDLNSSNGTTVGGAVLACKMKISLQKNEVILFANEKFRFI